MKLTQENRLFKYCPCKKSTWKWNKPANQPISQNKDSAETKLNCITLWLISEKINLFIYVCLFVYGMGQQGGDVGGSEERIKGWLYFMYPIKKDGTIKTINRHKMKLGKRVSIPME